MLVKRLVLSAKQVAKGWFWRNLFSKGCFWQNVGFGATFSQKVV
jgi:hypothetical protein